jgi:AraC-like DNA-binding protein
VRGDRFRRRHLRARFAALTGGPDAQAPRLRRDYNLRAPALEHVLRALVIEADRGGPGGLPFVEALVTAVSHQMLQVAGAAVPAAPARGGLAPRARRRVLELVEARLERGVSVDELAREAGLSPAHFARAFRETVGRPPHQYILGRRLERARLLLDAPGARLSDVALRAGFADQAHFTRLFKRAFGVTPGAVLRARRLTRRQARRRRRPRRGTRAALRPAPCSASRHAPGAPSPRRAPEGVRAVGSAMLAGPRRLGDTTLRHQHCTIRCSAGG